MIEFICLWCDFIQKWPQLYHGTVIFLFFIILIKCFLSLLLLHSVDPGGLAESCGLKPGQQLVDVNGVDFESICHALAVEIIRSSRQLVLTMRVRR